MYLRMVVLWFLWLVCSDASIIFSEIMYNPRLYDDYFEYVELYNTGPSPVNISMWTVPAVNWTFPTTTPELLVGNYLVLCANKIQMLQAYTYLLPNQVIGDFTGSLKNGGELLQLVDPNGVIIVSLTYSNSPPWHPLADGFGSSLELMCYDIDSVPLPYRWTASPIPNLWDTHIEFGGNPGAPSAWQACFDGTEEFLQSNILFSEIMYHPVGSVAIEEVHEFIELYNNDTAPTDLTTWRLFSANGVRYTFPEGTTLNPGEYLVIAKDPPSFHSVYNQTWSPVLGPYEGELKNGAEKVALIDLNGIPVDFVEYDDQKGWPVAADALGAGKEDLPPDSRFLINFQNYLYKGQSLARRSWDWPSNSVSTWKSADPSPGQENLDQDLPLLPVISSVKIASSDTLYSSTPVKLTFSITPWPLNGLSILGVVVEYYIEDAITSPAPVPVLQQISATQKGSGTFSVTFGTFPQNSIIRYRINATIGDRIVTSPHPDDPFRWLAFFIAPQPPKTGSDEIHLFIRQSDWTQMYNNINEPFPYRRVTGNPVCFLRPEWNGRVPAVIVHGGKVVDCQVRYEGSTINRLNAVNINLTGWDYPGPSNNMLKGFSIRVFLPRYGKINGNSSIILNKMYFGCSMYSTPLYFILSQMAGLGASSTAFARVNINGGFYRYMMLEQSTEDIAKSRKSQVDRQCLHQSTDPLGHIFKCIGGGSDEGPYGVGDFRRLPNTSYCPMWSELNRYEQTYERATYKEWGNHVDFMRFLVQNFNFSLSGNSSTVDLMRNWLLDNMEVDLFLNYAAITNWVGSWDNSIHNYNVYQNPNTMKYEWIPWDADFMFGDLYIEHGLPESQAWSGPFWQGLLNTGTNRQTFHYLKSTVLSAFQYEYMQRLKILEATILSQSSLNQLMDEIVTSFNLDDAEESLGGWQVNANFTYCDARYRRYFSERAAYIDSQITSVSLPQDPVSFLASTLCSKSKPTVTPVYNTFKANPGAPPKPKITSLSSTSVTIEWQSPAANGNIISFFRIQRATSLNDTFIDIGTVIIQKRQVTTTAMSFTDTPPSTGGTYYRVQAVTTTGSGPFSPVLAILDTTPTSPLPSTLIPSIPPPTLSPSTPPALSPIISPSTPQAPFMSLERGDSNLGSLPIGAYIGMAVGVLVLIIVIVVIVAILMRKRVPEVV